MQPKGGVGGTGQEFKILIASPPLAIKTTECWEMSVWENVM